MATEASDFLMPWPDNAVLMLAERHNVNQWWRRVPSESWLSFPEDPKERDRVWFRWVYGLIGLVGYGGIVTYWIKQEYSEILVAGPDNSAIKQIRDSQQRNFRMLPKEIHLETLDSFPAIRLAEWGIWALEQKNNSLERLRAGIFDLLKVAEE